MVRFGYIWAAIAIGSAMTSLPAAAQQSGPSRSLTHLVSVTVASRVKVEVSSIPARSAPAVGKLTPGEAARSGIALTVRATEGWALSVKSAAGVESNIASARSGGAAPATMAFLRDTSGSARSGQAPDLPMIVTVSAP